MSSPERNIHHEVNIGAHEAAAEQAEKLRKLESKAEKGAEQSGEKVASDARKETEAIFARESGKENRHGGEPTASPATVRKITQREKNRVYKQTLARVQSEMSMPARTFSKVIHAPVIEKSSEIIGSTAARPNALLSGSVVALVLLSFVYAVSQTYGYQLSGFEMIAAYGLGYVLGLGGDYLKALTTRRA